MSPPAIGERIARLERAGVIRGYRVDVDWSALGYVTGYLAVTAIQGADQSEIMRALHQLPEVWDISVITGSMDMLARIRVRDYTHLRRFLLEGVWQTSRDPAHRDVPVAGRDAVEGAERGAAGLRCRCRRRRSGAGPVPSTSASAGP